MRIRVWDIPARVTHWVFVVGVVVSWWTAETGRLEWHRWSGYTLLGTGAVPPVLGFLRQLDGTLQSFRARTARDSLTISKASSEQRAGHNPLGALSVLALLGLLLAQIVLGLFAVDVDGMESGPLSSYVSFQAGRLAAEWHEWVFNALMVVITLHLLAVLFYAVPQTESRRCNGHGHALVRWPVEPVSRGSWLRLIIGIVLATGLTWAVSKAFQL